MKSLINIIFVVCMALGFASCYPDNGDLPNPEVPLVITLDPDQGTALVRTFSTSYDFKVKVESRMPAQGVEMTVIFRQDSDNQIVFSQTYTTNSSLQPVTITNIPFNEVGTVTVSVTSKTRNTNTATKTFKLVKK